MAGKRASHIIQITPMVDPMTRFFRLFGSHINNKLALLSVIPVLVFAAIITWHTVDTRNKELQDFQIRNATQVAKSLATAADFALYSGREDLLRPMAKSASEITSIAKVLFLTSQRDMLLTPDLPEGVTREMVKQGNYKNLAKHLKVFEEPVYLVNPQATDLPNNELPEDNLVGWVVVISDNAEAMMQNQKTVITHLLISFTVLLGAILLTYILSNNVVSPIIQMTETVRELERGNLNARIVPTTADELAILANGINHLARAVAESREKLEHRIELATEKLRNTLEDLKQKNSEMEIAKREAENASTAKGEFLAHMSHELRTPITAIQGFVNLLTGSDLDPSQQRYCSIVQQASNQLLQLIDDILDITRLQSNAVALDNTPFNLADCVEAPLSLMASSAHEKGLELVLDISPNVPYQLKGDSLRIRQIMYNLISNAIKFTPSGYVSLKVSSIPSHGSLVNLIFQVTDTGIGIPDKDKAKLFDAFSQADNSISRRFGGSGLGLSIVKRLVNLMNGSLQLESTAGKGTRFTIQLPLETRDGQSSSSVPLISSVLLFDSFPESRQGLEHRLTRYVQTIESCEDFSDLDIYSDREPPGRILYSAPVVYSTAQLEQDISRLRRSFTCPITVLTPATSVYRELDNYLIEKLQPINFIDKPPRSSELEKVFSATGNSDSPSPHAISEGLAAKILVAEDNEFTRILLSTFFEGCQCQLFMAKNGREAMEECSRQTFDMILMDVHMPEVTGITALQNIRNSSDLNKSTPIVMLTADIHQQEEDALFEAGASDLLFKPFNEQKLLTCIRRHLEKDLAGRSAANALESKRAAQQKLFLEEIGRLTDIARQALEARDEGALRDATHQLLGIAGVYQMPYLERAVQSLHKAIKSGNGNKMFAAMTTLRDEVEKLKQDGLTVSQQKTV